MTSMTPDSRVHIAGHTGMVGRALVRRLEADGFNRLILRNHAELDLTNQRAVHAFYATERPEFVILAAARVGGIHANSAYPADFIRDNLAIQTNVIHSAWAHGARKLLFLGSSCIYPRDCAQPIREEYLLTGPLEISNEAYAIAKIAGIKMCGAYRRQYGFNTICAMPTNLYGPGDNYHPENSHVVAALIRKFLEAKQSGDDRVVIWGSGEPQREWLHVDDMADALVLLMRMYDNETIVNIGSGQETTIRELARTIADIVGYQGTLAFDGTRPDGVPRKRLEISRLQSLGWRPRISLEAGLRATIAAHAAGHP